MDRLFLQSCPPTAQTKALDKSAAMPAPAFTTRPEIKGTFGAVTSTHWIASAVGMGMLERGGNAFDAAVATGFALQVVEPHLNGPLGDVPIIFWSEAEARPRVLCGQGPAPAGATIQHFRGLGLDLIPGIGLLPAVVPGSFDAWMTMLRDYGTMSLADVLEPAISYAENGYPLLGAAADTIAEMQPMFAKSWPTSAATWLPGGKAPAQGSLFTNKAMAATYKRVVEEAKSHSPDRVEQIDRARDLWYRGFVAEAIDAFCRTEKVLDSSGREHGGLLRAEDMAAWKAGYEAPVHGEFRGMTVCKTGPWGQGPVLLQQLGILDALDLDRLASDPEAFIHTIIEAAKLAFADRDTYYGDPTFTDVPLDRLLSAEYATERARMIGSQAANDFRPGKLPGFDVQVRHATDRWLAACESTLGGAAGAGEPTMAHLADKQPDRAASGDTCHLDIVDRWGNMVSATPSGGWLQSAPVIPPLGMPLGTRAQMFWLDEKVPAALAPRKRPRTTLTPTLILRGGRPALVCGTPGGDQQDQWQAAFLLRHLVQGMDLQAAIDAPLFHSAHFQSSFYPRQAEAGGMVIEPSAGEATIAGLRKRGHKVTVAAPWSVGRLCAAGRDAGGIISAAATPRLMQAYAVGR